MGDERGGHRNPLIITPPRKGWKTLMKVFLGSGPLQTIASNGRVAHSIASTSILFTKWNCKETPSLGSLRRPGPKGSLKAGKAIVDHH